MLKIVKRILNKVKKRIRLKQIQRKYRTKKNIKIYGKIQLDNPNITFGDDVKIYPGVQIWGDGRITIGNNVAIGKDTIIYASSPMFIGNDTSIAGQCYIIDSDHGIEKTQLIRKQVLETDSIFIGNDVWIGAGTKVLRGSYISEGSVIGAMSLVKGFTEPFSVNVGIPTKKIKERM